MDEALLRVENLTKQFRARRGLGRRGPAEVVRAVDGGSFEIREGETLGLVGESGSGKSTTGYMILQLLKPTSGSVIFAGTDLASLSSSGLRRMRRELQIIFQDPYSSLDPRLTVEKIVADPLEVHGV